MSFILGTAVTATMRHYLHKRVNIRLQMEAVGGCIQNIAMILASINRNFKKLGFEVTWRNIFFILNLNFCLHLIH